MSSELSLIAIFRTDTEKQIFNVLVYEAAKAGFLIADLEISVQNSRSLLRIFIDLSTASRDERESKKLLLLENLEEKDGRTLKPGITLEDCVVFSRQIDPILDSLECLRGPFELEVSSPGVNRALLTWFDFEQRLGEVIHLKIRPQTDLKRKVIRGKLLSVDRESSILEVDDEAQGKILVPANAVRKANLFIEF